MIKFSTICSLKVDLMLILVHFLTVNEWRPKFSLGDCVSFLNYGNIFLWKSMSLIGNGFINKRCRKLLKMFFQMDKIKDKGSEKVMIICLIAELISLMLSNSIKRMSHYFPDSVRVDTNKVKFDLTNYATKNYIYIYI